MPHRVGGLVDVLFYRPMKVVSRVCKNLFLQVYLNALSPKTFRFRGKTYRYFFHRYNTTWENERAVEVPVVEDFVRRAGGKRVLEVGNVLSHYFRIQHEVVDEYERARSVINEDVVHFRPSESYDLIVSVSTLEHVGWDEEVRDPEKVLRAVENLFDRCLSPGGMMVVTLPLGYNSNLDLFLGEKRLRFDECGFLKRISAANLWEEVPWELARGAAYGDPFPCANVVLVGVIRKPEKRRH